MGGFYQKEEEKKRKAKNKKARNEKCAGVAQNGGGQETSAERGEMPTRINKVDRVIGSVEIRVVAGDRPADVAAALLGKAADVGAGRAPAFGGCVERPEAGDADAGRGGRQAQVLRITGGESGMAERSPIVDRNAPVARNADQVGQVKAAPQKGMACFFGSRYRVKYLYGNI
jgi:hypothetical protein